MSNTAVLRLNRTEEVFSLTVTLPRPAFRLPKRSKPTAALPTEEARLWKAVSFSKEHRPDLPDKRLL